MCRPQIDIDTCWSALVVVGGRSAERTELFRIGTYGVDIPTALASSAIRAERAAIDRLGPLAAGPSTPDLGLTAAVTCDGVVIQRDGRTLARVIHMACPNEMSDAETPWLSDARIRGVHISPDRQRIAVTLDYASHRTTEVWHETAAVVLAAP